MTCNVSSKSQNADFKHTVTGRRAAVIAGLSRDAEIWRQHALESVLLTHSTATPLEYRTATDGPDQARRTDRTADSIYAALCTSGER